jgi:hypothetical protein
MAEPNSDARRIVERLAKLESENRWLKGGFLVVAAVIGAIVVTGAMPQTMDLQAVTARKFLLVDANGKSRAFIGMHNGHPALSFASANGAVRATFGVRSNGNPALFFYTNEGKPAAGVTVTDDSRALALYGPNGTPRVSLTTASSGQPTVDLADTKGRVRAALYLNKDGQPVVALDDAAGKVRALLSLDEKGRPQIDLYGTHRELAALDTRPGGEASLKLFEAHGEVVLGSNNGEPNAVLTASRGQAVLGASADGQPALALYDSHGKARSEVFLAGKGQPAIALYDAGDRPRALLDLGEEGKPNLALLDPRGNERLVLGSTLLSYPHGQILATPLSSLTAFDKKGNVLGTWPAQGTPAKGGSAKQKSQNSRNHAP